MTFISADASNNPHHLCLVTYHIPPEFIPEIKSHGNSKSNQPFFPTWPSTKELIKQESEHGGPKETVAKVSAQVGGILKATCSGQLPRNERQVMYLSKGKAKANTADELYEVMFRAKQEEKDSKFATTNIAECVHSVVFFICLFAATNIAKCVCSVIFWEHVQHHSDPSIVTCA